MLMLRRAFFCRGLAILLLTASPVLAQKNNAKPAAQPKKPNPVLAQIEDVPGLPRVLLIGDSISMGYTLPVRELLKGKANVHRPSINCGPTIVGVANLDKWLGDGKWDVIHFNFGLHDVAYRDTDKYPSGPLSEPPAPPRHPQVSLEEYEKNLTLIVERLEKTGAKLIWRNTTPVPVGSANRVPGSEVKYNEAAAKIMAAHNIPIEDLYAFVQPRANELMLPKNVHFTGEGSQALAEQVAATIQAALPQPQ